MAIEQTVDEVQISRAEAAGAHGKRACHVRLGTRRERGCLLTPDVHPLDLALAAQGLGQAVQTVADDSVYALHGRRGQSGCESICNGAHESSPESAHLAEVWRT